MGKTTLALTKILLFSPKAIEYIQFRLETEYEKIQKILLILSTFFSLRLNPFLFFN